MIKARRILAEVTRIQRPAPNLYEGPEQIWRLFISHLLYLSDPTEKKHWGNVRYYETQEIKFLLFDLYLIKDEILILQKAVNPRGGFDSCNLLQQAKRIFDEIIWCLKSCLRFNCFLTVSDHKLALEVGSYK